MDELVDIDNPPPGMRRCPTCDGEGVEMVYADEGWVTELCHTCNGELLVPTLMGGGRSSSDHHATANGN